MIISSTSSIESPKSGQFGVEMRKLSFFVLGVLVDIPLMQKYIEEL